MSRIFFSGAGKMATAIAGGMVKSGKFSASKLAAFDPDCHAAENFTAVTGVSTITSDPANGFKNAEVVFIAVKPQMVSAALDGFSELLKDKLIISIAAGISIARLKELTGSDRIIRVMPNTPALVNKGATAYSASNGATELDCKLAGEIFSAVGTVIQVKESDLNAVTALSGSGPAYVFEFIQALADGGVAEGLPRDTALMLAVQTVIGAAEMIRTTGEHPASLKDKVTSPAGTTSRALQVLAERSFAGSVIKAVRAAADRSRELGKNND